MKLRLNPRMVRFAQAVTMLACIAIASTGCVVIDEDFDQPFDIDPPAELWEIMHDGVVDDIGRDWIARCLDNGGRPEIIFGISFCADRDY
jgi:hypothetical protein